MSEIVDDLLEAMETMKKLADPNPVVRIDVSLQAYDFLSRECRARKDETTIATIFTGIPIHIVQGLPTGCRVHRADGTTEDLDSE